MKKLLLILVSGFLLGFSIQTLAAINSWTAIGPTGGTVNKLAFSKTGQTAFAIAAGGFYRSPDAGTSWQLIASSFFNPPFDMALDPADPQRIYVVAPNWPSLYVSTDGGATLAPAANLPTAVTQARQIAVSADGRTLYIVSGARVFRSVDRAQSWQAQGAMSADPLARVIRLIIDPTDANTLYATAYTSATAEGVMASHDGGATWQPLLFGMPLSTSFAADLAINAANPLQLWVARDDGVWMSGDRGTTWNNITTTPARVLVNDPVNPAILYAGTGYGNVYRTSNSGATWLDVTGNLFAGQIFSIAINPSQESQLLVGGLAGVSGSSTSGTVWGAQQSGLMSTTVSAFSADPGADRIYIEIPSVGIYYTSAGSATAIPVNNAGLAQLSVPPTSIYISSILAQPGSLWASQTTGMTRSLDGGNTWSQVQVVPTPPSQLFAMASAPSAPQIILAASGSALYRSTDGGALWTQVTAGLPAGTISKLLMESADPTVAYAFCYKTVSGAAVNLGVYKSTDGGLNWSAANAAPAAGPGLLLGVDPTAANVLYGSTGTALLKSTDSGATWSALNWDRVASQGYPNALAVDPVHPQNLYAASVTRIARSVDGGASWETLRASSALPVWGSFAMIVDSNRPADLLVGTLGSGVQEITIAPDLALTTTAPSNPVAVGVASSYAYTASNLGPFDATGVIVTLQLTSTVRDVSATIAGGSCAVAGTLVTCSIGILRTGSSAAITLSATPPAVGTFSISGSVSGDQPDPGLPNNSTVTAINVTTLADLSVSAAGSSAVRAGDPVSYTLTVRNAGPNPAPAASVALQFAAGLTPGTVMSTNGSCSTSGTLTTCTLGNLTVAGSATISVSASATVTGQQVSTATVSSATGDPVNANNSVTLSTTVSAVPAPPTQGGGGGLSFWDVWVLAVCCLMGWRSTARQRSVLIGRPGDSGPRGSDPPAR